MLVLMVFSTYHPLPVEDQARSNGLDTLTKPRLPTRDKPGVLSLKKPAERFPSFFDFRPMEQPLEYAGRYIFLYL
jgi:hypothetical protein